MTTRMEYDTAISPVLLAQDGQSQVSFLPFDEEADRAQLQWRPLLPENRRSVWCRYCSNRTRRCDVLYPGGRQFLYSALQMRCRPTPPAHVLSERGRCSPGWMMEVISSVLHNPERVSSVLAVSAYR